MCGFLTLPRATRRQGTTGTDRTWSQRQETVLVKALLQEDTVRALVLSTPQASTWFVHLL